MTPAGTALLRRIVLAVNAGEPLSEAGLDGRILRGLGDLIAYAPSTRPSGRRAVYDVVVPTTEGREALAIAEATPTKTRDAP